MTTPLDIRRRWRAGLAAACAVLCLAASGCSTGASGSVERDVAGQLARRLVEKGAVGAVVQVRSGWASVDGSAGTVQPGRPGPAPDPQAQVRVASITKSMVAVVVLQLVDEGKIGLDEPVRTYLPDLPTPTGPYTVRNLLDHTTGMGTLDTLFPKDVAGVEAGRDKVWTDREQIAIATAPDQWTDTPGKRFKYSNANCLIAAAVAEKVTGTPMATLIAQRVFGKAGMTKTLVPTGPAMPPGSLPGFLRDGERLVPYTEQQPSLWSWGANVVSTVGDVNRFYRATFDGTLLSPARAKEMRSGPASYKLGVFEGPDGCGLPLVTKSVGNRGNGYGYGSISFHSPDGQRQVTMAWNGTTADPGTDSLVREASTILTTGLKATC